jgi:uncharacterized membrane protein
MTASGNGEAGKKIIFGSFIFIYLACLFFLCNKLNVSIDETCSLNTTSKDLSYAIKQSYSFEGQPPVYFALLSVWRGINSSVFFARLFSVFFVCIAAFVFYRLVHLVSDSNYSKWLVMLFLINPFTIATATDIRLYAFLLCLSLVSIYCFFKFYIEEKNSYLYFLVLTGIIGLYTQYLYIFLFVALGLSLLLFKGWKLFFKFILFLVPLGLLFLYNVLYKSNPMDLAMINSLSTTITERFVATFHSPQNLILALNVITVERTVRWLIIAVFMVLSVYTYIKWYKKNKTTDRQYFEMYNVIIVAGCILMLLISAFFAATALDYYDRYAIIAYPLFISAFLVFKSHSLFSRRMIFAVIIAYYALVGAFNYRYTVKEYDQKSLAGYITAIQNKGEPILFYQKVLSLPFSYYYSYKENIVTLPDSLKFDSTYFSKTKDTVELGRAINAINTPSNSYLLVSDRVEPRFQNDADIKMMNDYFNNHFNITLDTLYYGNSPRLALRVRRFEKK